MTADNQKGQASVFVLLLIGVVLLSAIFLFQSGRLTSEKMQLQNAADSAAFGAATLEARSLNFAAYTNRAMAANEVAIGQMIGILSFVDELKTTGEYIDEYAGALEAATAWLFAVIVVGDIIEGIISALVTAMEDIGSTITEVGEEVEKVMETIASPVIRGFSIINQVYSISQTTYHGATIVLVTTNILQSLEDNVPGTTPFDMINMFDPKKPGAHLSDFGILALVGHLPSYWQGYTKRYTPSKQKKEKKKSDQEKEEEKKEQELLTREQRQIKKDKKNIAEYQRELGAATTKQTADRKTLAKALLQQSKDKKECAALKAQWDKDHKADSKQEYDDCLDRLQDDGQRLTDDHAALVQDKANIDSIQTKLKAAQARLAADKKKLSAEEEHAAELDEEEKKKEEKEQKERDEENEGMQRMAATVRDARDPFSSGGPPVWDKNIFNLDYKFGNRDWEFGYGFDINLHVGKIHFGHLKFFTGLDSKGGSELRYKGDNYVWSAIDTAVLEAELEIMGFPIELAIPTGGGGYQAASSAGGGEGEEDDDEGGGGLGNVLTVLDMPPTLGYYGKPKAYGSAGYPYGRWLSWEGATAEMEENVIEGNPYGGLQPYRDMTKMDDNKSAVSKAFTNPFAAPFFIVGVIRKYDDIQKDDPKFAMGLNLIAEHPDSDRVGAIAKSEVYFDRPQDLSYFLRMDKKVEKPNVFSPFWQARLAKTSDMDRFLAMALQHKKIWLAKHEAEKIPGLESMKEKLENILKLF